MLGVVGSDPSASPMPPESLSWPCKWSLKERAATLCMVSAGSELQNNALSRAPDLIYLSEEETSSFSIEVFQVKSYLMTGWCHFAFITGKY